MFYSNPNVMFFSHAVWLAHQHTKTMNFHYDEVLNDTCCHLGGDVFIPSHISCKQNTVPSMDQPMKTACTHALSDMHNMWTPVFWDQT